MKKLSLLVVVCMLVACAPQSAPQPVYGMGIEVGHAAVGVQDDVIIVIDGNTIDEESGGEADCGLIIEPIEITNGGETIGFLRCGEPRGDRMGAMVIAPHEGGYQVFMLAVYDNGRPWAEAKAQVVLNGVTSEIPASLNYLDVIEISGSGNPELTAPEGCVFHTNQMVWFFTCTSGSPLSPFNA